jgi:hypothetical protein
MGMFADADFAAPDLDEFKRLRRATSALLARRVSRSRHSV